MVKESKKLGKRSKKMVKGSKNMLKRSKILVEGSKKMLKRSKKSWREVKKCWKESDTSGPSEERSSHWLLLKWIQIFTKSVKIKKLTVSWKNLSRSLNFVCLQSPYFQKIHHWNPNHYLLLSLNQQHYWLCKEKVLKLKRISQHKQHTLRLICWRNWKKLVNDLRKNVWVVP